VPWSTLGSESVAVRVRDVLLCVEPSEWSDETHHEQIRINKVLVLLCFAAAAFVFFV